MLFTFRNAENKEWDRERGGGRDPNLPSFFAPEQVYPCSRYGLHSPCLLLPVTDFELELTPAAGRVFFLSDGLTFLRRSKYSPLCTINEIKHLFTEIIHATVGKARDHFSLSLRSLVNYHPKVLSRKQVMHDGDVSFYEVDYLARQTAT